MTSKEALQKFANRVGTLKVDESNNKLLEIKAKTISLGNWSFYTKEIDKYELDLIEW